MTSINPAWIYSDYRPRYPQKLIDDLRERSVGSYGERLIEWGCGTGELTLRLCAFFDRVTAIDMAPPMIDVAREKAREAEFGNVEWLVGRAEDFEIEPESCDLIASASAFHWMDRELLARRAFLGLKPDAALALVGGGGGGGVRQGDAAWHRAAAACVKKRLGDRRAKKKPRRAVTRRPHADFLLPAGFRIESFDYPVEFSWGVDEVIGYLYSIDFVPRALFLGDSRKDFERELRTALLGANPSGAFHQRLDFHLILAHRR